MVSSFRPLLSVSRY